MGDMASHPVSYGYSYSHQEFVRPDDITPMSDAELPPPGWPGWVHNHGMQLNHEIQHEANMPESLPLQIPMLLSANPSPQPCFGHAVHHGSAIPHLMWDGKATNMAQFDPIPSHQFSGTTATQPIPPSGVITPSSNSAYPVLEIKPGSYPIYSDSGIDVNSVKYTSPPLMSRFISSPGTGKRKHSFAAREKNQCQSDDYEFEGDASDADNADNADNADEDPDQASDPKRQRFLARNRVAATRCRQKKKDWMTTLEEKARILSAEQQHLQTTVNALRQEVLALKCQCLEHIHCDCQRIRGYLEETVATMKPNHGVYQDERLGFMSGQDASIAAKALAHEARHLAGPF